MSHHNTAKEMQCNRSEGGKNIYVWKMNIEKDLEYGTHNNC